MGPTPSSRTATLLAIRALALTLCVPLAALAILAASAVLALRHDIVILAWAGLFLALPGLQALHWARRRDRAAPAGVDVDRAAEPGLWRIVGEECRALGVAAPQELRISLDHAVCVARAAGGRTLVVGAPLAFAVPERVLRVAVAHALLRDAGRVSRLLDGWACRVLDRTHAWAVLPLSRPWRVLARRIWPQVAAALRAQVLLADVRCSERLGAAATAGFLRAGVRERIFATYWREEVVPCLDAGYRPPLLEGWRRFRQDAGVCEHVSIAVAGELDAAGARDDPQPALGARMAAVEAAARSHDAPADGAPLAPRTPPDELEAAALAASGAGVGGVLVPLGWEHVAHAVWRPQLITEAVIHRRELEGHTLADLPRLARLAVAPRYGDQTPAAPALDVLAAALAVALERDGWKLVADPPGPLRAVCEDSELLVLHIPHFLSASTEHEDWDRVLQQTGVAGLPLAPAVEEADRAPAPAWPTMTVASRLALRRTPQLRRMTTAAFAIAGPLGVGLCAVMAGLAVTASGGAQVAGFAAAAAAASGALLWWLGKRARIAYGSGSLRITDGELRIEDRGLLRAPLVIDRAQVRAVAIDEGTARNALGLPLRFPFGPSLWRHPSDPQQAASGWLWSGPHESSVRMLGAGDEVPNLLLLFSEPLPGPPMRLRGSGLPHDGEALAGLALRVDDARAAQTAFDSWGVVRPLSEEDGRMDFGPAFQRRRERAVQRRAWRRGWLLVACGVIVPPIALVALWDAALLRSTAPGRALVLSGAAIAVFAARSASYAGWV